jgi:sugar lactone lactonase YvrE
MVEAAMKARFAVGLIALCAFFVIGVARVPAEPGLFVSEQLTPTGEYSKAIEGPAVDKAGTLFVVGFKEKATSGQERRTIGKVSPGAKKSVLFARLPEGSAASGIRFDDIGRMYVTDYKQHKVFVFEPGQTTASEYVRKTFDQPNDLAVAADGTLYASDPKRSQLTGRVWRIARGSDGKGRAEVLSSSRQMGVTNGIDLSPDGKILYVSESTTNQVWAYTFDGGKLVSTGRPLQEFKNAGRAELDGLRTDADGRIFVAFNGKGTVAMLAPDGTLLREIQLKGKSPSNLAFGGPDGKTVFVTQVDGGYIESFRTDRPGREFCKQAGAAC